MATNIRLTYSVEKTWDDRPIGHPAANLTLSSTSDGSYLQVKVSAPYFNDPKAPAAPPGPFFQLWNYEVVEAFFLGENERYLEVELGPHGHHLLLFLDGARNSVKDSLPLDFQANILNDTWEGIAKIPKDYFPPNITLFNAYAIHGTDPYRAYESLYPVPKGKFPAPDFHRLEYFQHIDFENLMPGNAASQLSAIWSDAIANPSG